MKQTEHLITFKRALEMIRNTKESTSPLPVSINRKVDGYFVYQNFRELTNNLAKYENQKAEIVEMLRRTLL